MWLKVSIHMNFIFGLMEISQSLSRCYCYCDTFCKYTRKECQLYNTLFFFFEKCVRGLYNVPFVIIRWRRTHFTLLLCFCSGFLSNSFSTGLDGSLVECILLYLLLCLYIFQLVKTYTSVIIWDSFVLLLLSRIHGKRSRYFSWGLVIV